MSLDIRTATDEDWAQISRTSAPRASWSPKRRGGVGCLGFTLMGTVPEAFDHPRHGYVGLHVMHLPLV